MGGLKFWISPVMISVGFVGIVVSKCCESYLYNNYIYNYIYIYSTHQKDRTVKINPNTVINYFSIFKLHIEWNLTGQNIEV